MLHDTQRTSAPSSVERLDEHRRLNRHVQAAHDAGAGERLLPFVALADRHQAGHLVLGQANLLAAPLGQVEVRHLVGRAARAALARLERVHLSLTLLPLAHSPR